MQGFFPGEVILIVQQKGEKVLHFSARRALLWQDKCLLPPYCFVRSLCTAACAPVATESQKAFGFFCYDLCCKLVLRVFVSGFGPPHLQLVDC